MKKYFTGFVFVLILLVLVQIIACQKNQTVSPVSACNSIPDNTHIYYTAQSANDPNSIQVLVTDYCSYQYGCHQAGSLNGDYTTYQGIETKVNNGSLYNRVVVQRDMPPAYSYLSLDSCQIKEFYLWIKEGGPQY